jgi:hypothetical protein
MHRRTFALSILAAACGGDGVTFSRRASERFSRRDDGLPGLVQAGGFAEFPESLAGVALWFDARRPKYSDSAGAAPAGFSAPVRRVDLRVPAGSFATAASDAERPLEENGALNFHVAHMMSAAAASSVTLNDWTFALNYTLRDLWYGTILKQVASIIGYFFTVGINGAGRWFAADIVVDELGSNILGTSPTYHPVLPGLPVSVVARIAPTVVKVSVVVGGARSDFSIARSGPGSAGAGPWQIGGDQTPCAISQALIVSRAISDSENEALLAWLLAHPAPSYFPANLDAVVITGDSIARSLGITDRTTWWTSLMQESLCATRNINVFNAAQSGDPIGFQQTAYPAAMKPFYNAARAKNIFLAPIGINNMRTLGQSAATALAEYYSYLDLAQADGFLPIACTVLPCATVAGATTDAFNADVRANWASRGYSDLADVGAIPGMANTADTAVYQDGIHPTAAVQPLLASVYAAAVNRVRG